MISGVLDYSSQSGRWKRDKYASGERWRWRGIRVPGIIARHTKSGYRILGREKDFYRRRELISEAMKFVPAGSQFIEGVVHNESITLRCS